MLQLPPEQMDDIVGQLVKGGLLLSSDEEPPHLLPARAPEAISLKAIVDAVSGGSAIPGLPAQTRAVMQQLDDSLAQGLHGQTLRDLLDVEA